MDYTVHGILQARILEWVAFPFSRGSSQSRDWTQVSRIAGRFFSSLATREALINITVVQSVRSQYTCFIKILEHWRETSFVWANDGRVQLENDIWANCLEWGFPGGSDSGESAHNVGDLGLIPWSGISLGEENGYPLRYSCLENSMDKGAWLAIVHGVTNSRTWLSD